ncbi:MAG: hypothetical protein HUJ94_04555 [Bacteroidales bacterium]|nr:hypothetical protein [Bacteroidales bacterium]
MKVYKIVLGMFAVFALLALLCRFYPEEGVTAGPFNLRFPSLAQVMGQNDTIPSEPEPSPEELLAMRREEARVRKTADYLEYFRNSPARIHFPNDSIEMLDPFFSALEGADTAGLRIVHYGDSQIEEDRISATLRRELQNRFGGNGPGLLPLVQTVGTSTLNQWASDEPARYMVYGQGWHLDDGAYGVRGQVNRLSGSINISFLPYSKAEKSPSTIYRRATVLAGNLRSPLSVTVSGNTQTLDSIAGPVARIRFNLPDSTDRLKMSLSGRADIYGIQLDGVNGVTVDNVPMRGSTGAVFTKIAPEYLVDYFRKENVRMIILQYGGNAVPYLKAGKSISSFVQSLAKQILHLKRLAPEAAILFIGPADMATSIEGSLRTYPSLPTVVDSLKTAVLGSGAMFWDMFEAMGGANTIVRWAEASPPLAAKDYVHFSRKGADKVAEMLCNSLMLYYDCYCWRNHADRMLEIQDAADSTGIEAPADSLLAL